MENINKIPKFVINLERRKDRLESITKEMNWIGWDFEVFKAIDTNSYMGITLSHIEIFKICEERGYDRVMIIEDDSIFMPSAKETMDKIDEFIFDFDLINFSPTLNRPVNSHINNLFLDLTNYPEAAPHLRGTYSANMSIYNSNTFEKIKEIDSVKLSSESYFYAFDDWIYQFVHPNFKCVSPYNPVATQTTFYSDISHGDYNNFYLQTYNWNLYSPVKIPSEYMDYNNNQRLKYEN
jgi:hypothetical protein